MTGNGGLVGSLNLVSLAPTEISESDLRTAQMLSDIAVSYIFAVRVHAETSKLADQLQNALDTRVVIAQAKGILSERHGESMTASFARLRQIGRATCRERGCPYCWLSVVAGSLNKKI